VPTQHTNTLLVGAGGAGLTSLERHVLGNYLGAFFCIAGPPLHQRLTAMGGYTNIAIVTAIHDPTVATATGGWAYHVCTTHNEAKGTLNPSHQRSVVQRT
jgi:hypothetical protein